MHAQKRGPVNVILSKELTKYLVIVQSLKSLTFLTCARLTFVDVHKKGHSGTLVACRERDQTRLWKCLLLQSGFRKNRLIGKVRFWLQLYSDLSPRSGLYGNSQPQKGQKGYPPHSLSRLLCVHACCGSQILFTRPNIYWSSAWKISSEKL